MGILRNGRDLLDHWTLKSGVSHKWYDESSRLAKPKIIQSLSVCKNHSIFLTLKLKKLNHFCMLIVIQYVLVWPPIYSISFTFAGCPLAVVLVKSDTLHLAPTVKFSKPGFPKYF